MTKKDIFEILTTEIKFLCFRSAKPDLSRLGNLYLTFGILTAWLAGIGRYWDNPRVDWWQHLGLGSVVYIFILALILWLMVKPLRPQNWNYKNVLVFIGMTSPLGILYAIPVERYFSLSTAETINVWFLAVVATWRVILWALYLKRSAQLKGFTIFIATFLPLVVIISILTFLNLDHVVFNIMGGINDNEKSVNDAAYGVLAAITFFSILLSPILLISYSINIWLIRKKSKILLR